MIKKVELGDLDTAQQKREAAKAISSTRKHLMPIRAIIIDNSPGKFSDLEMDILDDFHTIGNSVVILSAYMRKGDEFLEQSKMFNYKAYYAEIVINELIDKIKMYNDSKKQA